MSKTRFTHWIVLACIGTLAACTSEGDTAGTTELNIIVPADPSGTGTPSEIDIGTVEYTIDCAGNTDVFLDNAASFPNAVTLNGNLEVVDGRPAPPGSTLANSEIWQGFMDLPPGPCTVQLRARDDDGEVICTATEPFNITADNATKVDIILICDISFQAPVGMLDVDGTFSFNVGNFCPNLFVLNCAESNPQVPLPGVPPTTYCETRWEDGDSTCGDNCDEQVCTPGGGGLICTPGPDPGVSTTVTCDSNGLIDCQGDFVFDASCSWGGDVTGNLGSGIPVPVLLGGPGPDRGGFFVACNPGAVPGSTVTCTAVTTDGDIDCDKSKIVQFDCPGLLPCEDFDVANGGTGDQAAADALCDADPVDCLVGFCDNGACDGATAGACCATANAPASTPCQVDIGGTIFGGTCDNAGACISADCAAQPDPAAFCDDGNACTTNACEADGSCSTTNVTDNTACVSGSGSDAGVCLSGACTSTDECTAGDVSGCTAAPECFTNTCDVSGAPFVCDDTTPAAAGTICTGGGSCDGAGVCNQPFVLNDNAAQQSNWQALPKLCTQGIFDATANTYQCCTGVGTPPGLDKLGDPCAGNALTTTDVPGGGLASANSDPTSVVNGCSVPSSTLGGQLAVDTFLDLTVSSADGSLTTVYVIRAVNAGLGLAAAIANLVDLSIETDITSGNPGTVFNFLDPAFVNTGLSAYISGLPATLILDNEILPNTEPVVPTTAPSMDVNFSGRFLLELFLTTAGTALPVDGNNCVFDIAGANAALSTTDPN